MRLIRTMYIYFGEVLVVLCPDPAEAVRCRKLIRPGHPGFDLAPIVIDSGGLPGRDGGGPYLTVFAASWGFRWLDCWWGLTLWVRVA